VVEAVLIAGLCAAVRARQQVTAAVLVYRALTWALPILIGVGCWLWWHQSQLRSEAVATGGRQVSSPRTTERRTLTDPAARRETASRTRSRHSASGLRQNQNT
jgi:hypothetical protein